MRKASIMFFLCSKVEIYTIHYRVKFVLMKGVRGENFLQNVIEYSANNFCSIRIIVNSYAYNCERNNCSICSQFKP